jgi:long-chain acyl-CoA synthetase
MAIGGSIGYFTGDPLRLLEDAQVLKPDIFPSVPRVLNRIYQAAMVAGSAPGLKGVIFQKAVRTKLDRMRATGNNTHALWDKLVFRKVCGVVFWRTNFEAGIFFSSIHRSKPCLEVT